MRKDFEEMLSIALDIPDREWAAAIATAAIAAVAVVLTLAIF